MNRARWLWILGWVATTLVAVVAFARVEWTGVAGVLASASPGWLAAALLANLAILGLWSIQWRIFLPRGTPVSPRRMFEVVSLVSTVANGGPPLTGHATGVHLLAARAGTGYATGLSVVALDQVAEGLAKISLLAAVLVITPLPPALRGGLGTLLVVIPFLTASLVWAAHRAGPRRGVDGEDERSPIPEAVKGGVGSWAASASPRLMELARSVAARLDALRKPRVALAGFTLALAMKAAELGGIWAVQRALGADVGWSGSLLALAAVAMATMVSLAPANLGVYEASAFAAYRFLGVDPATATAVAVVQHAVYLVPAAGTGWLLLTLGGARTALTGRGVPRL